MIGKEHLDAQSNFMYRFEESTGQAITLENCLLGLHEEISEVGRETKIMRKPWKAINPTSDETILGEVADVFIFAIELVLLLDIDEDRVSEAILQKIQKNRHRLLGAAGAYDYDTVMKSIKDQRNAK